MLKSPEHIARDYADLREAVEKVRRLNYGGITRDGWKEWTFNAILLLDNEGKRELNDLLQKHLRAQLNQRKSALQNALAIKEEDNGE